MRCATHSGAKMKNKLLNAWDWAMANKFDALTFVMLALLLAIEIF